MRIVRPMSHCGVLPVGRLVTILSTRCGRRPFVTNVKVVTNLRVFAFRTIAIVIPNRGIELCATDQSENAGIAGHAGKWSGTQNTDHGGSAAGSGWAERADLTN